MRAQYHHRIRNGGEDEKFHSLSVWTPNVNIFRDPRWGRGQETYGEDPYLTAVMGTAVVRGLQGPEDSKYRKLWACANVDARSTAEVIQLKKMSPTLEHELYLESGQTYSLSALPRILWVKNNLPDVYEKTAAVGMLFWVSIRTKPSPSGR